jgi:hypothetical protein
LFCFAIVIVCAPSLTNPLFLSFFHSLPFLLVGCRLFRGSSVLGSYLVPLSWSHLSASAVLGAPISRPRQFLVLLLRCSARNHLSASAVLGGPISRPRRFLVLLLRCSARNPRRCSVPRAASVLCTKPRGCSSIPRAASVGSGPRLDFSAPVPCSRPRIALSAPVLGPLVGCHLFPRSWAVPPYSLALSVLRCSARNLGGFLGGAPPRFLGAPHETFSSLFFGLGALIR